MAKSVLFYAMNRIKMKKGFCDMNKNALLGLLTAAFFFVCLSQTSGDDPDARLQEGKRLYEEAQKQKSQQKNYASLLKRSASCGWIPAVFEDAELELNSSLKLRIVNAGEMVRNLEKIIRTSNDPKQQAHARYLLGLSHEKGVYTFADRKEALKNYLLGASQDLDARVAAIRLLNTFAVDTKFGKENRDAVSLVLYSIWCQAPDQDSRIAKFPLMMKAYESDLIGLANAGDTLAMYYLATHYLDGTFFPVRKMKGMEYLKAAVAAENPYAQLFMGEILMQGLYNQPKDIPGAVANFKKAFFYPKTSAAAASHLIHLLKADNETPEKIRYLISQKRYQDAMAIVKKTQQDDFSPMVLYLQAKIYEQTTKASGKFDKDEFERLLGIAVNSGSLLAKEEMTALARKNTNDLYQIKLQNRQSDDPEWMYQTALLAIRSVKAGKTKPKEALRFLNSAAKSGNLSAIYLLISAYEKGAPVLEIKPDAAKAQEYRKLLLKHDIKYAWTKVLIPEIKKQTDDTLAIRAAAYNPAAAAFLAKKLAGGKTEAASVLLNSLAAGTENGPSVEEYEKQVQSFISTLK